MLNILIFGYGREGKSTENFFKKQNPKANIVIYDEKTHPEEPTWETFDIIFLSPGIAPEKIPLEFRSKTTNQVQWFLEQLNDAEKEKIIGITGSKGKTTTTILTNAWLKKCGFSSVCAGNIGHPVLDVYSDFKAGKYDFLVLELSSFQIELLKTSPGIAVFLSLFPDHLDRHKTLEAYGEIKSRLWQNQNPDQHLIVTQSGKPLTEKHPSPGKTHVSEILPEAYFPKNHVFRAKHFRENLGIIEKLSEILGQEFDPKKLKEVVSALEMPEHRLEFVAEKQGIKFYNDAIATNPEAVIAAVKFFGENLGTLILGGTDGGGEFDELFLALKNQAPQVQVILTDSPITKRIQKAHKSFPQIKLLIVQNLEESVEKVLQKSSKNQVCLLSPGGKSFDQFPNYTVKGRHFKKLVQAL